MVGTLARRVGTAATTAALTVGTFVVMPGAATAVPGPVAPEVGIPGNAFPGAQGRSAAVLLTDLRRLYRQTRTASEAYSATQEKLRRQRTEVIGLNRRLTKARAQLHESRQDAGRLARLQYQGSSGGLSPYLRLLLANDPQHVADQGHVIGRVSASRAATVRRLTGTERRTASLAVAARESLAGQEKLARRQKKDRETVRRRLAAVEKMLASLKDSQLAAANGAGAAGPQSDSMWAAGPQPESSGVRLPSRGGSAAVSYAVQQIGKPYVWGAQGPSAFDCSGLTSQAWASAGVPIPRTSQQQWASLRKVALSELRPGDLIVYFPGATHVGLYLGGGKVVHAPRPGTTVRISPMRDNPVLGAVRPDAAG